MTVLNSVANLTSAQPNSGSDQLRLDCASGAAWPGQLATRSARNAPHRVVQLTSRAPATNLSIISVAAMQSHDSPTQQDTSTLVDHLPSSPCIVSQSSVTVFMPPPRIIHSSHFTAFAACCTGLPRQPLRFLPHQTFLFSTGSRRICLKEIRSLVPCNSLLGIHNSCAERSPNGRSARVWLCYAER